MDCAACGAPAQAGQRFCGQCGQPLAAECPGCGAENPPGHSFCGQCGTALTDRPAASDAPVVTERRVVSVLFVDLVGFTSFSEGRDPEDVRALITDYFDVARDVVDRFGGTVDKYIGDAVMAWWGATTSLEDDAERAVRAALETLDRVTVLGEERGIPGLAGRAGVMTGEAAVGPGGNDKGLLLGDLVNSASRLQSLAEPGTVLVGDRTASLVSGGIDVRDLGEQTVKGKSEPIRAWRAVRVMGERGGRGRADSLEPPFVGREPELRLLKDALRSTGQDGRARAVSLVGQAGIGKSRLVREFQKYVDGLVENVFWHEGRSPSYGDNLALWALGEMVRARARIQETDDDSTTAAKLGEAVATYVDESSGAWVEARLAALLGLPSAAAGERTEIFAAARTFFEGIARQGTVVLVFEDLHWADPGTLEFIEDLTDWSQDHPILMVTLARPDFLDRRPDWGAARRGSTSAYLAPLANEELGQLVRGTVTGISDTVVGQIVDAAGGIPLFAVEMLRMLIAEGDLVTEDGRIIVARDIEHLEIPSSVQAVVAARLDRLPQDERELVRDAAVLGFSFTADAMSALRDESVDKLERRLSSLVRREILELNRDPRSPERGQYRWVQGVVREVSYGRIARADRRDLHLRVARYFRGLDDPELAPIAASHLVDAVTETDPRDPDLEEEMVGAVRAAIDRAEALHAYEQVLTLTDVALPVVPPEVEVDLRESAIRAAVGVANYDLADSHAAALRSVAEADGRWRNRYVALAGWLGNETRRSGEVLDLMAEHLAENPDLVSDPYLARTAVYLARALMLEGEDMRAAELADRALGAAEPLGLLDDVADAMITRGTALAAHRYHQGMALLRGALALCREHDLVSTGMRALINVGYASQDPVESFAVAEEALAEAKRVGDRNHGSFVAANLAGGTLYRLELDRAETVLADPVWSSTPGDLVARLTYTAGLAVRRGQLDEARDLFARVNEMVADLPDPQLKLGVEREQTVLWGIEGDHRRVFETGLAHMGAFAPGISAVIALSGAGMLGEPEAVDQAAELALSLAPGAINDLAINWAECLKLLVHGDRDAGVEAIDRVVSTCREQRTLWIHFLISVTAANLLPVGDDARARWLADARSLVSEVGAPGLMMTVDQVEASAG